MLTTNPFDDDKLKEECGIFGIWGAEDAASFVALGLHALQHRGPFLHRSPLRLWCCLTLATQPRK